MRKIGGLLTPEGSRKMSKIKYVGNYTVQEHENCL